MAKSSFSWSKPDGDPDLIGRKKVDWSVFEDGTGIPLQFHTDFAIANHGEVLYRGEAHDITLIVEGQSFHATLMNVDRTSVAADTLQIRYDSNEQLKAFLAERLEVSYSYLQAERRAKAALGKKVYAKVPDSQAEYLDFYSTGEPFKYRIEIVPHITEAVGSFISDVAESDFEKAIDCIDDEAFERWLNTVSGNGDIDLKPGIRKVRRLKRHIIQSLKARYNGKCQICGFSSLAEHGVDVSEGHHIDHFTKSKDNRPTNLAILCPTHHSLVHALDAVLDRETKEFVGSNGRKLPLVVNYHL